MVVVALVAFACFLYTAPAGPVMMESAAEKALKYAPSLSVAWVAPPFGARVQSVVGLQDDYAWEDESRAQTRQTTTGTNGLETGAS